jgi:type I restriction enzyme S subunit
MPLPPVTEQAFISAVIDRETARIDALIAKKTRFIELLKEKRQALITHAVTKGLDPRVKMKDSGVEWIGKVPEHWDVAPIKRWFSTTSGATPDTEQQAKYYADAGGSGVPWIRTTDLSNGPVTTFAIGITQQAIEDTACKLIPKKSVLVAMYGGDGTIGKNGLLEISACINQAICALLPNERFVPEYTFAYIQHYRPHWMVYAASTRKDPNISQEIIREAPIVCPPVKEQQQVAAFLKTSLARLDVITEKTQRSIDLLKERRAAFITAAVTGQIDLRESA